MRIARRLPVVLLSLLMLSAFFSCGETAPTQEVRLIDSLNQQAYSYRYKDLDSCFLFAKQAYLQANLYKQGKAEACSNLGFCAFMQMNFDDSERFYKEAHSITPNELERLIADIGLMKIYQRTSMNKKYYDYRNSALRRMKRIREDINVFVDAHEIQRLNFAFSEFYIVSAIYYYYLQQKPEAVAAMNEIDVEETLESDTSQYLYYQYIKGSAGLCGGDDYSDNVVCEFDNLYLCLRTSISKDYLYFEANCLQALSELLDDEAASKVLYNRREQAIQSLNAEQLPDSVIPYRLAREALKEFVRYNDIYQIAGTYRTVGSWLNKHGHYAAALDTLRRALDYVNIHHERYYHCVDTVDRLRPFIPMDSVYTELTWINQKDLKTVPEWIARIREQLSVAYAGLGMKVQSDYNRNIYLDILDYTRQDKELESRFLSLEKESRQLNLLIFIVIMGIVLISILFWIFNKHWKRKNREDIERLRQILEVCQKITASVPSDANCADEIVTSLTTSIAPDLESLLEVTSVRIALPDEETGEMIYSSDSEAEEGEEEGVPAGFRSEFPLKVPDKETPIGVIELYTRRKLAKEDTALVHVIIPYIAWTIENGLTFISLDDERKRLEKECFIYEQHISENKRQNLVKKTCMSIVSGINPFIDRILNEVDKLTGKGYMKDEQIKRDKYQYIDELITRINEYNDILALWIKMKQGSLSLNVENFQLNDLFEVLAKGRRTFEMKNQTFNIEPVNTIIKADKALTLFMINTLTENARKYTPEGGSVRVYADEGDDYVEISVEDTGRGLTPEDVSRILGEKVYDSSNIGMAECLDAEDLQRSKGSGFGLMNCKGIIEKYRKTNDLFKVCLFSIDSVPGKGSRFYFRLPKGVRKTLGVLFLLLLSSGYFSCGNSGGYASLPVAEADSATLAAQEKYEELLNEASYYADTAYYCNVMGDYGLALQYIDSSMTRLNRHYRTYAPYPKEYLHLRGDDSPAEMGWWTRRFDSDYHVILDIRNEAAVAFLALKDLEGYRYNNEAYTALYKILGEDNSLSEYCSRLQHSTNNKIVGIIICILLLLITLIGYYILYIRRRFVSRQNLEQVLEINECVFAASVVRVKESDIPMSIPEKVVDGIFDAVNELLIVDTIGLTVYNEDTRQLSFVFNPRQPEKQDELSEQMRLCFQSQEYLVVPELSLQCLPLLVDVGDTHRCVGVLAFVKQNDSGKESDRLLAELIARYIAIVIFNSVVKLATKYRDIESAQDDARRASWENSLLHVQNMVLDNCLSTIKHETIYYPNKIKQIIDKLNNGKLPESEEKDKVNTISELISYYKDIYTILSSCASRQLEEVAFRRSVISTQDLAEYARKYFKKVRKRLEYDLTFEAESPDLKVTGDLIQLRFLLENLINEASGYPASGRLSLKVVPCADFVCFLFTDSRREKTVEELNQLFYPDLSRMTTGGDGQLSGTEYLVCRQIIRDHDEFAGKRGCRINAEPASEGGFTVYFTIPKK